MNLVELNHAKKKYEILETCSRKIKFLLFFFNNDRNNLVVKRRDHVLHKNQLL